VRPGKHGRTALDLAASSRRELVEGVQVPRPRTKGPPFQTHTEALHRSQEQTQGDHTFMQITDLWTTTERPERAADYSNV